MVTRTMTFNACALHAMAQAVVCDQCSRKISAIIVIAMNDKGQRVEFVCAYPSLSGQSQVPGGGLDNAQTSDAIHIKRITIAERDGGSAPPPETQDLFVALIFS